MPSIPEKTIVFEGEQIEKELARQINDYKKLRYKKKSSPGYSRLSSECSKSVTKSPKHALSPVDILSGAAAVD